MLLNYLMSNTELLNDEAPKIPAPLPLKYQAFQALRANGFHQSDAAVALGYSKRNGTNLERKLHPRDDLTSPTFVRLAAKVIKSTLKAEPIVVRHTALDKRGELVEIVDDIYPKPSDRLNAAGMVVDRSQPIKRSEDSQPSITFIQINLDGCK